MIHRLPNGIRLATTRMPHMASIGLGVWADVGSRHESLEEHGMAHLVEHLLFKGTPERSAMDISRQVERLGASLDAYTVEDHTCYHTRSPADAFPELLGVMADMYQNPVFDPAELESEKRVIGEEISMVRDQPAQLLEDLISEATWGAEHPLGRTITGTLESLESHSREKIDGFFRRHYCGKQTVISVAGALEHGEIHDLVAGAFSHLPAGDQAAVEPAYGARFGMRHEEMDDREQAHLSISFRCGDRYDPDRFSQKIMNVILGENMSSRMFQFLREQLGLCYEIQSEVISFADAGVLQVYLALDPDNLSQALAALSRTFGSLCHQPPSQQEVDEAISYCVGQSAIHLESVSSQMMWAGECLLSFDKWIDPDGIYEQLQAVTPARVQASAQKIFTQENLSVSIAGPASAIEQVSNWATGSQIIY